MPKKRLCVAVSGLNNVDSPGPGVPVIRALRECPDFELSVIGLSYDAFEPGVYMPKIADRVYQVPFPSSGSQALYERLADIHRREKLDAIIPNFDAELPNFIALAPRLRELGIRSFLPSAQQFGARDKQVLAAFCAEHGLESPQSLLLNGLDELPSAMEKLGLPLLIKGKYYEAVVVHSLEEARQAFFKINAKWGLPIIAQEHVAGLELNVAALGDGQGGLISAVPMRKLVITDKGKAWAGVTLDDPKLVELAGRFVEATHWRGGFELELIRDGKGRLMILEVNPRFPAWIYLAAAAGHNQPAALLKLAMGQRVAPFEPCAAGRLFIRYAWDMVMDIEAFQLMSALGETPNMEERHATAAL